jgi:hypothetical protein
MPKISVTCPTPTKDQPTAYNGGTTGILFSGDPDSETLELRVHTPQFYRQVATYGTITEMLSYALLDPCEENRAAWSDDGKHLIAILQEMESIEDIHKLQDGRRHSPGHVSQLAWTAYSRLRGAQRPLEGAYPGYGCPKQRTASLPRLAKITNPRLKGYREYFLGDFVRFYCEPSVQVRFMLASLSLTWRARIMNTIGGE